MKDIEGYKVYRTGKKFIENSLNATYLAHGYWNVDEIENDYEIDFFALSKDDFYIKWNTLHIRVDGEWTIKIEGSHDDC